MVKRTQKTQSLLSLLSVLTKDAGCYIMIDMSKPLKEKSVTRTYRNGTSVFQVEFVIRLRTNLAVTKWHVTEQRANLKDEKIVFVGKEADAESFYTKIVNSTVVGSNSPLRK